MDLLRPIRYRGFTFNDVPLQVTGPRSVGGCTVQSVKLGDVDVAGYTEKRALGTGKDASDVFKGGYRFTIIGTLYGSSRGDLYDRLHSMESACDPELAYGDRPDLKGYCPITFYEPSEHPDWPDGAIPLFMGVRALSGINHTVQRDGTGNSDDDAIAIPYAVTFEAIDPRKYVTTRQSINISGARGDLILSSRGALSVPLNMLLVMDPQPNTARTFSFVGAGADFDIHVPAGNDTVVVRVDGNQHYVTVQAGEREVPGMHMRTANAEWPEVPLGDTPCSWTFTRDEGGTDANLRNDSVLFWREAFA